MKNIQFMQDVVDPVTDEMLAQFVVDSHYKSQPKGSNNDHMTNSQEDGPASSRQSDPEVLITILILYQDLFS